LRLHFFAVEDPKWLAFFGLLQVNARLVDRIGSRMERETGLPPSWFEVLAQLHEGPKRMSELAESLTLSRGGATRLIARIEEAGLVVREIPSHDRRATFARMTEAGAAALERAKPVHFAAVEEHFSRHITEEQAAAIRTAFARVLVGEGFECGPLTTAESLTADGTTPAADVPRDVAPA
jgi:DNA-binding MarR family transcriptional regulator